MLDELFQIQTVFIGSLRQIVTEIKWQKDAGMGAVRPPCTPRQSHLFETAQAKISRYGAGQPPTLGNAVSSLSVTENVGVERVRIAAPELASCFSATYLKSLWG